jgi:hypothetical protein
VTLDSVRKELNSSYVTAASLKPHFIFTESRRDASVSVFRLVPPTCVLAVSALLVSRRLTDCNSDCNTPLKLVGALYFVDFITFKRFSGGLLVSL